MNDPANESRQPRAEWFRALAETAAIGIFVYRRGRFLYVNPGAESMTGYPAEQLLRMGPAELVHPDHIEAAAAEERTRRKGARRNEPFEVKCIRGDGEERWASLTIAPTVYRDVQGGLATAVDITERKLAELEAHESRERLELAQWAGRSVAWEWHLDDDLMLFSPYGRELFQVSAGEVPTTGAALLELLPPEDREVLREALRSTLSTGEPFAVEHRARIPGGELVWLVVRGQAFREESGRCNRIVGVSADITKRKRAEADLEREREMAHVTLRAIADGVIRTDRQGRIDFMNPRAERLTGVPADEARGRPVEEVYRVVDEATGRARVSPVQRCVAENRVVVPPRNSILVQPSGSRLAIQDSAAPLRDAEGSVIGVVLAVTDLTRLRGLEREMTYLATHDPLTGLLNRREFEEHLTEALSAAHTSSRVHCLCYADLDDFKLVNDTCGHIAGDELLRRLAVVLQSSTRQDDVLGRLGGDEFGVLLRDCPPEAAHGIAEKLLQSIRDFRFVWEDRIFEVAASIGVIPVTADSGSLSQVLAGADTACYVAKDRGRNQIHLYEPDDAEVAARRGEMRWVERINRALEEDGFLLLHQPIVRVGSPEVATAFEILLRLTSNGMDAVEPSDFIPAAERYNLMPSIDRWVVDHALEALESLQDNPRFSEAWFTINLSGQSLGEPSFLGHLVSRLEASTFPPSRLCFEITETAAVSNMVQAKELIATVRDLGSRFILDDFGSGLSSFAYLKTLPVDLLKIDGALVRDLDTDPIRREMVSAIHRVARVMDIMTIGEAIETEATLRTLTEIGVDLAQGNWIARPTPLTG